MGEAGAINASSARAAAEPIKRRRFTYWSIAYLYKNLVADLHYIVEIRDVAKSKIFT
jgi:hypothetical protein